jgi:glutathione S-transferase
MMTLVHARAGGREVDREVRTAAEAGFAQAVRRIEERLEGREWFVGQGITAADITIGAVIHRVRSAAVLPWPAGCQRSERLSERIVALLK